MALRSQAEQDVADRVGVAGNADALQRAFAPALEERADLAFVCSRAIVSLTAIPRLRASRHGHRRQRVVVARHASGLAEEGDVRLLQERRLRSTAPRAEPAGLGGGIGRGVGCSSRAPAFISASRTGVCPRSLASASAVSPLGDVS